MTDPEPGDVRARVDKMNRDAAAAHAAADEAADAERAGPDAPAVPEDDTVAFACHQPGAVAAVEAGTDPDSSPDEPLDPIDELRLAIHNAEREGTLQLSGVNQELHDLRWRFNHLAAAVEEGGAWLLAMAAACKTSCDQRDDEDEGGARPLQPVPHRGRHSKAQHAADEKRAQDAADVDARAPPD